MVTEEKVIKKRYVPVAVTAKKVGEIEGEDILKIDMPINREFDREQDDDKKVDVEKENDMVELTEAQVDRRVSEMLGKLKLQETIDKIRTKNEEIENKIVGVDERLEKRLDDLDTKQEKLQSKQEEICEGVDCVKKDIGKIDELRNDVGKIKDVDEKLGKLEEIVGSEYHKCSGPRGCNEDIKVGSSFCPNCGTRIAAWEGHPAWIPYWKRQR